MPADAGAQPERVLAVGAHPDDVDFGSAGTIATWTAAGVEVTYCIVTDGDAGGYDPAVSRADMARIRRDEQQRAAEVLGVSDVIFLGYPDGRVEVSIELRRDITEVIRTVRPDRVLAQSPERNWQRIHASHPDHLAVGEAAMCAVYPDARNPFAHPELAEAGLEAWTVPEVWVMAAADKTDTFVDITDVFDRKVKALLSHESQHLEPDRLEERLRAWGTMIAQMGKLGEARLAEGFRAVATS